MQHFKQLASRINREWLVFSVFLVVAIIFWFLQTFKEDTSVYVNYKIELTGVPKNVIITTTLPDEITATLSGRGYSILDFLTKSENRMLQVDFSALPDDGDKVVIDNTVWRKLLGRRLGNSVRLTAINPSILEIYYSTGAHKYVPVEWAGRIKVADQHVLCAVETNPLYVDIYAPDAQFDTIHTIRTEKISYTNLTDTLHVRLALAPPRGVKCIPDSVDATICVDLFTTKKLQVPVFCEHAPENMLVRTFPSTVSVTFRVSSSLYDEITETDFVVVVDYDEISPDDKTAELILRGQPEGISNVQISPQSVEYIIEQQ